MNKVEGKISDWCLKCKNCKGTTNEYDGETASIRLTKVECEDPCDGMTKTLNADSDICCSMFEPKPACETCERFDGTYCHSPEGIFVTSYMATGNCSFYSEKKEKESFNLNMPREAIKAIAKLNDVICELEKEKAAHLKGIERLKKTQEKLQNQVKNLQTTNEESYKREEKLEEKFKEANEVADSWQRDYERLRDQFVHPIYNILYPDKPVLNTSFDINVTALLNDVKNLKIYAGENKSMYEDLKYWRERCHGAETDVTTLNSKVETLKNKKDKYLKKILDQQTTHYKQCARILDLENMVNKLQSGEYDDILAKDIEIKSLQDKYEAAMAGWKDAIDTNDKMIGEKDKQIEELTRRYNMIAKKLNDIHDILKEDPNNA